MKLIYLAHPYGGDPANVEKVEQILKRLLHRFPALTFYSPLHALGFAYSQLIYMDGMEHCFEMLSRCDELWLCAGWQRSRGCNMEYAYAKGKGIPIQASRNNDSTYFDYIGGQR